MARAGSFREAADELGYVQSAVSQQIAFLERLLGFRLVDRSRRHRSVRLTRAGDVIVAHSAEILARLQLLQAEIDALAGGEVGTLRVGATDDVARWLLAPVVTEFASARPHVEIVTRIAADHELLTQCEAGALDLVFADLPLAPARFGWRELMTDRYVLLVPACSRLAGQGAIRHASELAGLDLIFQRQSRHSLCIDTRLRASGVVPRRAREADSAAVTQALVGAGVGCALLPSRSVDAEDESVCVLQVGDLVAPRSLCVAWQRCDGLSTLRASWMAAAAAACDRLSRG